MKKNQTKFHFSKKSESEHRASNQ